MLDLGSMDSLLLRMVAPMLHRVVAILFMAGLVHGRKGKEVELKVGCSEEQPGLLPLAGGLHTVPLCPAVLHCGRVPSCRLQIVVLCASSPPLSRPAASHHCFHALQRHRARRQQLRMHGLHGLPRLKSLHPSDTKGGSGAGVLPQTQRSTPHPAHQSQMNGDAHAVRTHLTWTKQHTACSCSSLSILDTWCVWDPGRGLKREKPGHVGRPPRLWWLAAGGVMLSGSSFCAACKGQKLSASWPICQPLLCRPSLQTVQPLWPSGLLCCLQPGLVTPAALASPAGTPRGLPNDPARGGNIWQRCEELEDAAREMQAQKDALLHERMQAVAVSISWDRPHAGLASGEPTGHCRGDRER